MTVCSGKSLGEDAWFHKRIPILPPIWLIYEGCKRPCSDNTECQHSTPSLGNINSNRLLLAVMKSPVQEIHIMGDYLKDMQPIYSSRYSRFLSLDQARWSENCISGPNGFGFSWKQIYWLVFSHTVLSLHWRKLEGKSPSLAIIFNGRSLFFKLPVRSLCSFLKSHMGNFP